MSADASGGSRQQPTPRHRHRWQEVTSRVQAGFVVAKRERCATCPAIREWSDVADPDA